jgi:hypothetical protein
MAGKGKSFFANLSPSGRAEKAARVDGDPRATMADLLKAPKDTAEIYLPPRVGNITAVICKGKVFTAIDKTLADYVPALKASTGMSELAMEIGWRKGYGSAANGYVHNMEFCGERKHLGAEIVVNTFLDVAKEKNVELKIHSTVSTPALEEMAQTKYQIMDAREMRSILEGMSIPRATRHVKIGIAPATGEGEDGGQVMISDAYRYKDQLTNLHFTTAKVNDTWVNMKTCGTKEALWAAVEAFYADCGKPSSILTIEDDALKEEWELRKDSCPTIVLEASDTGKYLTYADLGFE